MFASHTDERTAPARWRLTTSTNHYTISNRRSWLDEPGGSPSTATHPLQRVHEARMLVKGHRVEVEKTRKALKEDALRYGQAVDREAKRITGLLQPIEDHLGQQETWCLAEKDRIKNEARLKAEAEARARAEAEATRVRAEQEAEAERLRVERQKLDVERRAMEAERAKIEAEQRRLAEMEAERKRAAELEQARAEAAERARIETEARVAREAAEAKAKAEAAEAARVRAEAMRPDREKLLGVASAVENLTIPNVSVEATEAAMGVRTVLSQAAVQIRRIVAEMEA